MRHRHVASALNHKLGNVYAELGRAKEAIPYLEVCHQIYQASAARDPENVRARFDHTTVDYDLGQAKEITGDRTGARQDYLETASILEVMLRRDPANLVWQGHRADALYRVGVVDRELGKVAEAGSTVREALAIAVRIATNPHASAEDLNRAADFLSSAEPVPWREPRKALQFALQATEKSQGTDAGYLLTLARCQQACGKSADAIQALLRALALLPSPPPGQPPTLLRASAEELLVSLRRQHP